MATNGKTHVPLSRFKFDVTEPRFDIGTMVKYAAARGESFAYGRVCGIEDYTDDGGTRTLYWVRWICPNGKPDDNTVKCYAEEIEPLKE